MKQSKVKKWKLYYRYPSIHGGPIIIEGTSFEEAFKTTGIIEGNQVFRRAKRYYGKIK